MGQLAFFSTDGNGGLINLKDHNNWPNRWTHVIPGNFGGSNYTDLLFYDGQTGDASFYLSDGLGGIKTIQEIKGGWNKGITHIIPGNFGGGSLTDLLFYNPSKGSAAFYVNDGNAKMRLIQSIGPGGWNKGISHIIPGNFGGGELTDLLFYSPSRGSAAFYVNDGDASMKLIRAVNAGEWRISWTHIIPGNFGGGNLTDLLFYEGSTGSAEFYVNDGEAQLRNIQTIGPGGWNKGIAHIIPGNFGGGSLTDLLFYNPNKGSAAFYVNDGNAKMKSLKTIGEGGWKKTWAKIIPGNFGGNSYTDLMFYSQLEIVDNEDGDNEINTSNLTKKFVRNEQLTEKVSEPQKDERHDGYICTSTFQKVSGTTPEVLLLDPQAGFVWPGHIVEMASIANGQYKSAAIPSENILPITISSSNLRIEGSSSATMDQPSLASYRDILKSWHQNAKKGEDPSNIAGNVKSFYSHADLDFQLRAAYKSAAHKIAGGVSFGKDSKTNKLFFEFTQTYYTVDVSNKHFEILKDSVDHDNFGYISSIKYGRIIVITFESEYTNNELRAAIDYTNGVVGENQNKKTEPKSGGKVKDSNGNLLREQTGVDLNVKYDKIMKSTKVTAMVIGGPSKPVAPILNISGSVADVAQKIVSLLEAGSSSSLQSPPAPVGYTVKFLSDGSIANVLLTTDYNVRQCRKVENGIFEVTLDSIVCTESFDADPFAGFLDPHEDLYGSIMARLFKREGEELDSEFLWKDASKDNPQIVWNHSRLRLNRSVRFTLEDFQNFKQTAYIEVQSNLFERDYTNPDDHYGVVTKRIYLKDLKVTPLNDQNRNEELNTPQGTEYETQNDNQAPIDTKVIFLQGGDQRRGKLEVWFRVKLVS